MTNEPIAITGIGAVTPLGLDLPTSWKALLAGRVSLQRASSILDPALAAFPVGVAPVDEAVAQEGFSPADIRKLDPVARGALAATAQAIRNAGLDGIHGDESSSDSASVGVVMGLGYGASGTHLESVARITTGRVRRLSPFTLTASMPNAAAANIAIQFGCRGPALTVSTACASGIDAIGTAMGLLRGGVVGRVICGGIDALCDNLGVGGMAAARALAEVSELGDTTALRPFDRDRRGTAVGSGAAVFVLETVSSAVERGAPILALLHGYGASCDAHHISAPLSEGEGAEAAMRAALSNAALAPSEVSAVFAHGTGTPLGDRQEGRALARLFEPTVPPITSTKGQTGHAMGASGAFNLAFAVRAMAEGVVPATVGCVEPDPDCVVTPVIGEAYHGEITTCMVNAFGFGGHNASIVVGAAPPAGTTP